MQSKCGCAVDRGIILQTFRFHHGTRTLLRIGHWESEEQHFGQVYSMRFGTENGRESSGHPPFNSAEKVICLNNI